MQEYAIHGVSMQEYAIHGVSMQEYAIHGVSKCKSMPFIELVNARVCHSWS